MCDLTNAEKRENAIELVQWLRNVGLLTHAEFAEAQDEALRRYPDPKTYKLSNLGECRYHNDKIEVRGLGAKDWHPVSRPAIDYLMFARAITEATIPAAEPTADPYEPTIVTGEDGNQFRIVDGVLQWRFQGLAEYNWAPCKWTVSDVLALNEIAHEYSERTK